MTNTTTDIKMDVAWNLLWNELFLDKTNLIYDFISSVEHEKRFKNLPAPEEIGLGVPNPCGWGTGMEDCMLNGGVAMDSVCLQYEMTKDEVWRKRAKKLFRGMCLCAEVHGQRGFVVRGVSPFDDKSCYINSSRDQFTLFVYGVWRFYRSELSDSEEKKKAVELLVATAEYCERTILPKNDYNLLRLDGKKAMVSKIAQCDTHEIMRLPMFYAAAWDASGDSHWQKMYLLYAVPGIQENLRIETARDWWNIALSQMQFSLKLLYEIEAEPGLKNQYAQAMQIVAGISDRELGKEQQKFIQKKVDFAALNCNWRTGVLKIREEVPNTLGTSAIWEGYAYLLPSFPAEFQYTMSIMRAFGNLYTTILLSPDGISFKKAAKCFLSFCASVDFTHCTTAAVVNLLEAWSLMQNSKNR